MHALKDTFIAELRGGFLAQLTETVTKDHDLDLEIRGNCINIYYKGNSLLKLEESAARNKPRRYIVSIDRSFSDRLDIPKVLIDEDSTKQFLNKISALKQRIIEHGISLETEYEQLIIRANNFEPGINSDYFVIDRQYIIGADRDRFDLTGFFWGRRPRKRKQVVPLCLIEVKFALNPDIVSVDKQFERYYNSIKPRAEHFAKEAEVMFRQKLDLGLYDQPPHRVAAMKTLGFATDISQFQFILVLVDYNPNSISFDPKKLARLGFSKQIKVFRTGFAMWRQNLLSVSQLLGPA